LFLFTNVYNDKYSEVRRCLLGTLRKATFESAVRGWFFCVCACVAGKTSHFEVIYSGDYFISVIFMSSFKMEVIRALSNKKR